jgi:CTP synthase (UTP-ammonia lyase)
VGRRQRVTLRPGTRAFELYGAASAEEDFFCNYGVNPSWVPRLEAGGLRVSGVGEAGEVRVVELPGHPFFVASLFLPQARSSAEAPHPLLTGFAEAVRSSAEARRAPPRQRGHA